MIIFHDVITDFIYVDQGEGHPQGDGEVGAGAELPPRHPQLSAGGALQVGQKELRSRDIFSKTKAGARHAYSKREKELGRLLLEAEAELFS